MPRGLLLGILILAIGVQCQAQPAADKALLKTFEPLYAQIRKAFLERNIDSFMALFAPPGTARAGEKTAKQDEVRVRVGMIFAMVKKMTGMKLAINQIHQKGDRAFVVSRYAYQGIVEPNPGKPVKMADRGLMKVAWARTPKGWRILSIDIEGSSPTINGKPMQDAMQGQPAAPQKAGTPKK